MADIIPNVVVSMPSQLFTLARSFKAAANGKIYIGKIDTDPTIPSNQIQVYIQNEDGSTVPVAQPILINAGGYPVYLGQISKFVTVEGHSMAIYDAYMVQQFYFPNVLKYDPDQFKQIMLSNEMLNMSPLYFHAAGDGISNDTPQLRLLESTTSNRIIDLGGRTYVVDFLPSKNKYVNGIFQINGVKTHPNGELLKSNPVNSNTRATAFDSAASLIYQWRLTSTWLRGEDKNAVQSLAFDEKNRFIYAMYETSTYGGSSVIYRMPMDWGGNLERPIWGADADARVGHQGLGVENGRDGSTYLWATKRYNPSVPQSNDPQAGCKVIRFPIDNVPSYSTEAGAVNPWEGRGGAYFEGIQEFILWPLINSEQNANATISHDQRFLITKMNDDSGYKIRVFSIDMLVSGGAGDYSAKHLHEFHVSNITVDPERGVDIQNMACDGINIYFHGGRTDASPTAHLNLQVYDMWGNYVTGNIISNLGYATQSAAFPDSTALEDEGIAFKYINGSLCLVVHMAGGTGGNRIQWLFALNCNIGDFRGTLKRPAIVTTSPANGLDLAYQRHLQWAFGGVNQETGAFSQNWVTSASKSVVGNGDNFSNGLLVIESIGTVGYPDFQILGNQAHMRRNASNAALRVSYARSRNITAKGSTAVSNTDFIFEINAVADDGSTNWSSSGGVTGAQLIAQVAGAVSTGVVPMNLRFNTMNSAGALATRWIIDPDGTLRPFTNAANDIGSAAYKPNNIFAVNGAIQTSDSRYKTPKEELSDSELLVASDLSHLICKYKLLSAVGDKGDKARYHVGVIAQEIISTFQSHGLDALSYGIVCYEQWDSQEEVWTTTESVHDEQGNLIKDAETILDTPFRAAGDMFSVRYDELSMFVVAGMSEGMKKLEERLTSIEDALKAAM